MANHMVKLKPFDVPRRVYVIDAPKTKSEGMHPLTGFNLTELSPETLSDLCDEFRATAFAIAGLVDPKA